MEMEQSKSPRIHLIPYTNTLLISEKKKNQQKLNEYDLRILLHKITSYNPLGLVLSSYNPLGLVSYFHLTIP